MSWYPNPGGAVLYAVRGPRGSYFAVHDPATGRVFTERTDHAARAQAMELGLYLAAEEVISHQELLRRTGRDADAASQAPTSEPYPQPLAARPGNDAVPGDVVVLPPQSPFLFDDTGESMIVRQGGPAASFFSSHPLEPQYSDLSEDSAIWRNIPTLNPPEEDWKAPER